jgi:hypothetical protein
MPPGVRPVERVYETDIARKYAPVPKIVAPKIDPSFYSNSRAFANARGVQSGLNIPGSTKATQAQGYYPPTTNPNPIQAAATARLGGGGGSSGGVAAPAEPAFTPTAVDLSKNPIPGYYDSLLAYVAQNSAARPAEFAALGEQFQKNRDESTKGLYDAYMGSRATTDASATALGVDPAVVSAARDLAMRKNQERSDQDLAASKDWLAKMGILSEQQGQAYGNMYAAEKAAKSAEWAQLEADRINNLDMLRLQALVAAAQAKAKGGGGGGRRGGGSSKGGSIGTSATDTSTMKYGGADAEYLQSLINAGDYEGAALFQNQMNLTEGTPGLKSVQQGINDRVAATHLSSGAPVLPNNAWYKGGSPTVPKYVASSEYTAALPGAKKAIKELPAYQRILPGMMGISSILGNVSNQKKVVNTSKSSTKRT